MLGKIINIISTIIDIAKSISKANRKKKDEKEQADIENIFNRHNK